MRATQGALRSRNYRHLRLRAIALVVLSVGVALAAWAFVVEPSSLRVHEYELTIPTWPRAHDKLRIAVLADLHTGSPFNGEGKLDRIVRRSNDARPDLILLAGDFVIQGVIGGSFVQPEQAAAKLSHLEAPLGVYAVLGNHDWWFDAPRVQTALEAVGIRTLEDEATRLSLADPPVWLVGISDYWEGKHDIEKAMAGVDPRGTILSFTHNPDVFPDIGSEIDLTIAGHTHGGQVYLPLLGRPIVPSKYGQRFAIGHVVEEERHLFVAPGLGTSILPVRFRVPPEISVLTIRSASPQERE